MPGDLQLALRIRADLGNARQALDRLERELKQTGAAGRTASQGTAQAARGVDRAAAASRRGARDLDRSTRSLGRMELSAGRAARRLNGLYLALGGIGAAAAIRSLVDAGLEIERLEQRFTFAAGGIAAGGEELAFIRAEAERLGISFSAAASGYSALLAASRGTNVSLEDTRNIFLGVAEASAVLRLSQEEVEGALRAVQQIMSKGTLQAEEIRGQLGERIPGAFQIAARAMGVTTAELNKMLELGQVASDEFLPRFGVQLRKEFAEGVPDAADSAAASFARVGNAIERLQQSIAKSGLLEFLARAADLATDVVDTLSGAREVTLADELRELQKLQKAQSRLIDEAGSGRLQPRQRRQFQQLQRDIEALEERVTAAGSNAARALEEIARRARQRIEEIAAELAATVGESGAIESGRRGAQRRAENQRRTADLERQLRDATRIALDAERLAQAAEDSVSISDLLLGDQSGIDTAVEEARRMARELTRIIEQAEDRRLRATRDRIGAQLAEEARAIARIDELEEAGKATGEEAEAARTAVRAAGAAERARIDEDELDRLKRTVDAGVRAEEHRQAAAKRRAEQEARARRQAVDELAEIKRGLLDPYPRAMAEVEAWRRATVEAFEEAGLTTEEYGETVRREVSERLARAANEEADRRLRESRRWQDGAARAFRDYAVEATDAGRNAEEAVTNGLRGMEDALTQFVTTGKLQFSDLVNSIAADLARIAIRQSITGPLASALFGALGGGVFQSGIQGPGGAGPSNFRLFHGGGIAGAPGGARRYGVPPEVFAGAPRYHRGGIAGLQSDEVPIIAQEGEAILPRGARIVMPPAQVEIQHNNYGTPQRARVERSFTAEDGRQVIVVGADDIAGGGDMARAIEGRYGLAPPAVT